MLNKHYLVLVALSGLMACTKPDSGGDSSSSGTAQSGNFRTDCGSVVNGEKINPVDPADGKHGPLTYIGSNLISIRLETGEQLIKLHGLNPLYDQYKIEGAKAIIEKLIGEGDGYFYAAEKNCGITLSDGGQGVIGHVFSATGTSFSEALIKKGYASTGSDVCQGSLISSCYAALVDQTATEIAGDVGQFLWKPVSDSNGKLAVHSGPYGSSVIVAGETGRNQGGGNGYGSLARFSKPGCAYGKNVKVRVVNDQGASYLYKGEPFLMIPDGCQRWKIKNGTLSLDHK